jgi:AcrR family transcriptional regulator
MMADVTPRPAPAHRPSRRGEIIEAAVRVFGREGFAAATIADVADACGMVPAAVYYHFDGKDDLLAAAVQATADAMNEVVAARRDPEAPFEERLAGVVREVFEWADAHPDEAQLFYLWSVGASPEVQAIRQAFFERNVRGARAAFMAHDAPPGYDPELATRTAIAMSIETSVAWLSQDVFPDGTTRDDVVAALVSAVGRLFHPEALRRRRRSTR